MPLKELVAFARKLRGSQSSQDNRSHEALIGLYTRPPRPEWLNATQVRWKSGDTFVIEGDVAQPAIRQADALNPDALAYYVPFHFNVEPWGIFLRQSGVTYLACLLKGGHLEIGDEPLLHASRQVLLNHEMWHAAVEIACTRMELLSRRPLYAEYFHAERAAVHEEALANALALKWVSDGFRDQISSWMLQQGPGYRDFGEWKAGRFTFGGEVTCRYFGLPLSAPIPNASRSLHSFLFRGWSTYRSLPVTVVQDMKEQVSLLRPFPKKFGLQIHVHSLEHPPPHIHIDSPPGEPKTRYMWPALEPLAGDSPLGGRERRALESYVATFGAEISERVRVVFGELGR